MTYTPKEGTLIEKMTLAAHEIVDGLSKCAPRELADKTTALRNLQAAITDGLGKSDGADPSAIVMKLLELEAREKEVALAEREARLGDPLNTKPNTNTKQQQ